MKKTVLIFAILLTSFLNAFSLKDKIIKGAPGDYIVTEQAGTYTVLILRSLSAHHMMIEEIDIPTINHNPHQTSWKEWIAQEAPGHTAWVSYLIDLEKNRLIESYSHARGAWLYASDPNNFLARLLTLSLEKTPEPKRKRVGPAPPLEEQDRRALWIPPVIYEGKKIEKPPITAWNTRWPQDDSIISNCEIEIYFGAFSFPYWIEVRSPHYKAAIQTIDSGKAMLSPKPLVFQQSPFFIGGNKRNDSSFELHIHTPAYYPNLRLYALDLTQNEHPLIDISEAYYKTGEEVKLQLSAQTLQSKLQKGHSYRWALISTDYPSVVIYADTLFEW